MEYAFVEPTEIELYTITASPGEAGGWLLEGTDDGETWQQIDERTGEEFRWQRQTRPFLPAHPGAFRRYRLRVTDDHGPATLHQWELLA